MTRNRRQKRRRNELPTNHHVITVISDDDEEDNEVLPISTRAPQAAQQRASQEVDSTNDEPGGPQTRAVAAAARPAKKTPKKTPTKHPTQGTAAAAGAGSDGDDGDDAGSGCIICLELMAEQGGHRPASLRCGHVFGEQCIRLWLQEKPRCPQCNKRAKMGDITALFNLPKKVAAGSGAAAAELEQQLQKAQDQARREHERAQQLEQEMKRMQQELARERRQPHHQPPPPPPPPRRHGPQHLQQRPPPPPPPPQQQQQHWEVRWPVPPQLAWMLQGLPPPQPGQQAGLPLEGLGRPSLRAQQQGGAPLQARREALQAAEALPKRTLQQSLDTDTAAAAAGPRVNRMGLPAAAAAAAAAEERARSAGAAGRPGVSAGPGLQIPPGTWPSVNGSSGGGGGFCSSAGAAQRQVVTLSILPVHKATAAGPGARAADSPPQLLQQQMPWQQQQVVHIPGSFVPLQEYELLGSRAFDLDVEGTLLTVAEVPVTMGGCNRLRRISMLAPGTPVFMSLPSTIGAVRCLARQRLVAGSSSSSSSSSALMAVATDKGGLIVARPSSNNIIATVPTQAPVWSVAWNSSNEQQLLLGLDKGRLALVDLRMTGSRALLYMSGTQASSGGAGGSGVPWAAATAAPFGGPAAGASAAPVQPWHSLLALPHGWQQQHAAGLAGDFVAPEALLASTAGVYCWSSAQPDTFQPLLPSSLHGGHCEGLALSPDGCTIVASFRRPLGASAGNIQPAHWLARLAPAQHGAAAAADGPGGLVPSSSAGSSVAAAVAAGRQQLAASTLQLTGHSSMQQMTHGCFMPPLPDMASEQLLFASADEVSCEPRLWGCSSGAGLVQQQPWQRMTSPVLQLMGGTAAAFDTILLGALSERQLKLYSYMPGQGC